MVIALMNMQKPAVTVIMATYNHAAFVAEAVESVLSQRDVDFEFLISDDGSQDETRDIVASIGDARISFFPNTQNRGACIVTNELVSRASGKYIALINSDDVWVDGKLSYQYEFLEENRRFGAVFGRAAYIDRDGVPIAPDTLPFGGIFDQDNRSAGRWLRRFFAEGNCLCHPTIMVRRDAYEEIGPFSNQLRQLPDYDMWIRLLKRYEIFVSDRQLIKFRLLPGENASSQTRTNAVRTLNEHFLIGDTFFDDMSSALLIDGFSDILVFNDIPSDIHFKIETALLYFHQNPWLWRPYKMLGLQKMRALLSNPQSRRVLELDYGISDRWFHEQMAAIDTLCPEPLLEPTFSELLRAAMRALRRN